MRFRQTFIARVFLITVFLVFLAAVLNGMGWAIGGICEAGADIFLKQRLFTQFRIHCR